MLSGTHAGGEKSVFLQRQRGIHAGTSPKRLQELITGTLYLYQLSIVFPKLPKTPVLRIALPGVACGRDPGESVPSFNFGQK